MNRLCLLVLFLIIHLTMASRGDSSNTFKKCVANCVVEARLKPCELTAAERLFWWDCPANCRYECMWEVEGIRLKNVTRVHEYARILKEPVDEKKLHSYRPMKFYGKWVFHRIWGVQELASSLFSLFNLIPHLIQFLFYYHIFILRGRVGYVWLVVVAAGANAWVWSTIFHARDQTITERLDYFSAGLTITSMCWATLIDTIPFFQQTFPFLLTTFLFAFHYLTHIYHLHFVLFDYGYNMNVMIITSLIFILLWLIWILRHPERPYRWRVLLIHFSLIAAGLFEVFDFPPYFYLVDAHSLWHASTVPLYFYWFSILRTHLRFEEKKTR
mmetsp:Transcript_12566/g.18838  ORF Transcript_12566/g.18838 Transcript_12566/m.18838 type:complete len:328 (+) Transcript_12566:2-985(+)